jgi:hypothetical protein
MINDETVGSHGAPEVYLRRIGWRELAYQLL